MDAEVLTEAHSSEIQTLL